MHLPLTGFRVISAEQYGAGPYGTMFLAQLGAEVIKVEAVNFYDQLRNLGFLPPGTDQAWNAATRRQGGWGS